MGTIHTNKSGKILSSKNLIGGSHLILKVLEELDSRKFCRKFCVFFDVTAQGAYTPFLNENLREPSLEGGLYARLFI